MTERVEARDMEAFVDESHKFTHHIEKVSSTATRALLCYVVFELKIQRTRDYSYQTL